MSDTITNLFHGEGNPRNSEGAFVELKDGRILFAYTRYKGASWADAATADIADKAHGSARENSRPDAATGTEARSRRRRSGDRLPPGSGDGKVAAPVDSEKEEWTDFWDCAFMGLSLMIDRGTATFRRRPGRRGTGGTSRFPRRTCRRRSRRGRRALRVRS